MSSAWSFISDTVRAIMSLLSQKAAWLHLNFFSEGSLDFPPWLSRRNVTLLLIQMLLKNYSICNRLFTCCKSIQENEVCPPPVDLRLQSHLSPSSTQLPRSSPLQEPEALEAFSSCWQKTFYGHLIILSMYLHCLEKWLAVLAQCRVSNSSFLQFLSPFS